MSHNGQFTYRKSPLNFNDCPIHLLKRSPGIDNVDHGVGDDDHDHVSGGENRNRKDDLELLFMTCTSTEYKYHRKLAL